VRTATARCRSVHCVGINVHAVGLRQVLIWINTADSCSLSILSVMNFDFIFSCVGAVPMAVAARSKTWVCCRSLAGIVGSNPAGDIMSVSCKCCVLSARGPCAGLISRSEESYRVWCV